VARITQRVMYGIHEVPTLEIVNNRRSFQFGFESSHIVAQWAQFCENHGFELRSARYVGNIIGSRNRCR
jgi:hypothetical protein